MSLIDNHSAPPNGNLLRGWMNGAQAPTRHLSADKPWRPDPVSDPDSMLSAAAFLEQIDNLSRDAVRDEAMRALVTIKPSEIRALVIQVAKTKGRYLAAFWNQPTRPRVRTTQLLSCSACACVTRSFRPDCTSFGR